MNGQDTLTARWAGEHVRVAQASLAAAGRDAVVLAPVALRHAIDAREEIDALIRGLVTDLRAAGVAWAEIGEQLAVTKQAAQQRYSAGDHPDPVRFADRMGVHRA